MCCGNFLVFVCLIGIEVNIFIVWEDSVRKMLGNFNGVLDFLVCIRV